MVQLISIELWSILKIKIILILASFHNFQSGQVKLLLPHVTDDFKQLRSGLNFLKNHQQIASTYLISHIIKVMSRKQTNVFPLYILDYSLRNHVYSIKLQRILLYLCTYLCWKKLADTMSIKEMGKKLCTVNVSLLNEKKIFRRTDVVLVNGLLLVLHL